MWLPGSENPSDLASKVHADVDEAINSSFWRQGSPLYTDERFPNVPNAVIYGTLKDQVYTHFGFPNTSQHMTECFKCSAVFDTGHKWLVSSCTMDKSFVLIPR